MTSEGQQPARLATAHGRELGEELRRVRLRASMSAQSVADALGWSVGKVSKLESGSRGTGTNDIALVLGLCKADPATRERVLGIAHEGGPRSFVRLHDPNPDSLAALRAHERIVRSVTAYDPLLVPTLAQTEGYARALLGDTAAVKARSVRQGRVRSRNAANTYLIHETALRALVGDARTMRDQLLHLATMCSWHWHSLRVIPATAYPAAVMRTPVVVLTLAKTDMPIVYVETDEATVFHDDPEVIECYGARLARLARLALSPEKSRDLIFRTAEHYGRTAASA